jgi:hypothetical protein
MPITELFENSVVLVSYKGATMIKKSIHLRVVGLLLVVLLLSSLSTEQGKAATGINNVTVSNVRDNTFVVSWTTTVASNG